MGKIIAHLLLFLFISVSISAGVICVAENNGTFSKAGSTSITPGFEQKNGKAFFSMNLSKLETKSGRKLSFIQKLSLKLVQSKLKKQIRKGKTLQMPEKFANNNGNMSFIFGLTGIGLLLLFFVLAGSAAGALVLFLAAFIAAILAIVFGSLGKRSDKSDRKAKTGALLGWITLAIMAFLFILAAIVLASWSFV